MNTNECPRKTGLKNGLRQLTLEQLYKLKNYECEFVLDSDLNYKDANYKDGKFCALAVAFDMEKMIDPSQNNLQFGLFHFP